MGEGKDLRPPAGRGGEGSGIRDKQALERQNGGGLRNTSEV